MVFRSKMDSWFKKLYTVIFLFITVCIWLAPILDAKVVALVWIVNGIVYVPLMSLILWMILDLKYIFKDDYLFVKGGPLRSKIKYSHITKVAKANDLITGYRLVNSKNAIEIFYTTSIMGSVKISPYPQEEFIKELLKRCPNLENKLH